MNYLKIETDDKEKALSLISETMEDNNLHTITTKRCANGDYSVEIVNSSNEPVN